MRKRPLPIMRWANELFSYFLFIGVHRSFSGCTETAALILATLKQCISVKVQIYLTHACILIDTLNVECNSTFSTRVVLIGFPRPADPGNQCGNNKCPPASSFFGTNSVLLRFLGITLTSRLLDFTIIRQLSLPYLLLYSLE